MKTENIRKWIEVSNFALQSRNSKFTYRNQNFDFRIFQFKNTKNGYMIIWNIESLKAFHISRMKIDDSINPEIILLDTTASNDEDNNIYEIPKNLIYTKSSSPY